MPVKEKEQKGRKDKQNKHKDRKKKERAFKIFFISTVFPKLSTLLFLDFGDLASEPPIKLNLI